MSIHQTSRLLKGCPLAPDDATFVCHFVYDHHYDYREFLDKYPTSELVGFGAINSWRFHINQLGQPNLRKAFFTGNISTTADYLVPSPFTDIPDYDSIDCAIYGYIFRVTPEIDKAIHEYYGYHRTRQVETTHNAISYMGLAIDAVNVVFYVDLRNTIDSKESMQTNEEENEKWNEGLNMLLNGGVPEWYVTKVHKMLCATPMDLEPVCMWPKFFGDLEAVENEGEQLLENGRAFDYFTQDIPRLKEFYGPPQLVAEDQMEGLENAITRQSMSQDGASRQRAECEVHPPAVSPRSAAQKARRALDAERRNNSSKAIGKAIPVSKRVAQLQAERPKRKYQRRQKLDGQQPREWQQSLRLKRPEPAMEGQEGNEGPQAQILSHPKETTMSQERNEEQQILRVGQRPQQNIQVPITDEMRAQLRQNAEQNHKNWERRRSQSPKPSTSQNQGSNLRHTSGGLHDTQQPNLPPPDTTTSGIVLPKTATQDPSSQAHRVSGPLLSGPQPNLPPPNTTSSSQVLPKKHIFPTPPPPPKRQKINDTNSSSSEAPAVQAPQPRHTPPTTAPHLRRRPSLSAPQPEFRIPSPELLQSSGSPNHSPDLKNVANRLGPYFDAANSMVAELGQTPPNTVHPRQQYAVQPIANARRVIQDSHAPNPLQQQLRAATSEQISRGSQQVQNQQKSPQPPIDLQPLTQPPQPRPFQPAQPSSRTTDPYHLPSENYLQFDPSLLNHPGNHSAPKLQRQFPIKPPFSTTPQTPEKPVKLHQEPQFNPPRRLHEYTPLASHPLPAKPPPECSPRMKRTIQTLPATNKGKGHYRNVSTGQLEPPKQQPWSNKKQKNREQSQDPEQPSPGSPTRRVPPWRKTPQKGGQNRGFESGQMGSPPPQMGSLTPNDPPWGKKQKTGEEEGEYVPKGRGNGKCADAAKRFAEGGKSTGQPPVMPVSELSDFGRKRGGRGPQQLPGLSALRNEVEREEGEVFDYAAM